MPYPTYFPPSQGQQPMMQQPMQPANFSQRPAIQPQPMMRPMYGMPSTLIRVNGKAGADAFYMGPNETAALFDENDDVFFYKATDGAGYATVKAFRFEPVPESGTAPSVDYVTREELEALRGEINELKGVLSNGKQPVRPKGSKAAAEPEE